MEGETFDLDNFKAPILEGLTLEDNRTMPPGEKMRRVFVAFDQAREAHREWFLAREPNATGEDIWADWSRVTGCAAIIAKGMKDAAERDADEPFVVTDCGPENG